MDRRNMKMSFRVDCFEVVKDPCGCMGTLEM